MKYFKKIVGEKIYLSPRNSEDVEIFTKWLNDFKVTDGIGRSRLLINLNSEKEYLEKMQKEKGIIILNQLVRQLWKKEELEARLQAL